MVRVRHLAPIALLALLPACPLLDAQADVQQACATYPGVQVDAAPPGTTTFDTSFTLDQLDAFQTLAQEGFTLRLVRGEVRAASGITDFSFVDHAAVEVASGDPSSTLPTLDAFDCEGCGGAAPALELPASTGADLAPYVATGSLVVTLDFTGRAPATAWSVDVDVCVTGTASYQLQP